MSLQIYLARHGQNVDNVNGILNGHRDLPLTDLGREQAQQLGREIKAAGLAFDAVYSSPLSRAYETAEIVSKSLGIVEKPTVLPALIERDFGIMAGKKADDIVTLCAPDIIKTNTITYFLSPEGAETFPQLVARGQQVLADIRNRHTSGNVLLVTHGDLGKMIYVAATGKPWREVLTDFHFGNAELIQLSPHGEAHVIHLEQYNL